MSSRIRITQILEAADGGTRTHLLHILDRLDKERFDFTLIASCERAAAFRRDMERLAREGVRTIELPMVRSISPWRDTAALFKLRRMLRLLACDIVHTHASKAGALGRPAARMAGVRTILHTPHTFYYEGKSGLARGFYRRVERALMPFTTRWVLLSESQRRLVQRDFPAMASHSCVIANGVDTAFFAPKGAKGDARERLGLPPDGTIVGTILRFLPQKAPEVLLHAFARAFESSPLMHGIIVGEGAQRPDMLRLADRLRIRERILWLPHIEDPRQVYSALDLFVLPSRYEGMPYTLLEAMSMSCPVIATRISAMEELIDDGNNGRLVPVDDPAALAHAMIDLLCHPGKAAEIGRAARARAEAFSIQRFAAAMTALYSAPACLT